MTRAQLLIYKGAKCAHCGITLDEIVSSYGNVQRLFEFHHINPESKDPKYKNLIRRKVSWEQLNEIDKCVLLCRNCHALAHAGEKCKLRLTVEVEDRQESQIFNGQIIKDHFRNTGRFLTVDPIRILPYWVKFGCRKESLYFGTDLQRGGKLIEMFNKLKASETFEIFSYTKEILLLSVTALGNKKYDVKQNLNFTLLAHDFITNDGIRFLSRKGFVLTSEGEVFNSGNVEYCMKLK